jgi:nucleoside-diphosphate-sugar epimerase
MSKILITGGAGFIAGALAERLSRNPVNDVVIVDNLVTGKSENILKGRNNLKFIKCDINNFEDISGVFFSGKFDYVFHYAALVGVQRTLENPVKVLDDINGIRNILNLSKNTGVRRVYYSSSSEVYGEPVEIPQHELTTPLNSRLPYAIVKNVGEAYLRAYQQEYDLEYTIFRFFNTYGPGQSDDFVVSKFIKAALQNQDLLVYGDGQQTRTFLYIEDNIEASVRIFEEQAYLNDVVNIGSDNEIPIIDLAAAVIQSSGSLSKIKHLPPLKEGDMTRRKPDITKMRSVLNRELIPLNQGLSNVISAWKTKVHVRD